jgi:hypothetical protein
LKSSSGPQKHENELDEDELELVELDEDSELLLDEELELNEDEELEDVELLDELATYSICRYGFCPSVA